MLVFGDSKRQHKNFEIKCNKPISHSFIIMGVGEIIKLSALIIQLVSSIQRVSWGYKNFVKML